MLALIVSEIIWRPQIYTWETCTPMNAPQWKNVYTQSKYFTIPNGVFNLNFPALVSEITGVPNLH